jgi:hypothetical protein
MGREIMIRRLHVAKAAEQLGVTISDLVLAAAAGLFTIEIQIGDDFHDVLKGSLKRMVVTKSHSLEKLYFRASEIDTYLKNQKKHLSLQSDCKSNKFSETDDWQEIAEILKRADLIESAGKLRQEPMLVIDELGNNVSFDGKCFELHSSQIACLKVLEQRIYDYQEKKVPTIDMPQAQIARAAGLLENVTRLDQIFRSREDAFDTLIKKTGHGRYCLNISPESIARFVRPSADSEFQRQINEAYVEIARRIGEHGI